MNKSAWTESDLKTAITNWARMENGTAKRKAAVKLIADMLDFFEADPGDDLPRAQIDNAISAVARGRFDVAYQALDLALVGGGSAQIAPTFEQLRRRADLLRGTANEARVAAIEGH